MLPNLSEASCSHRTAKHGGVVSRSLAVRALDTAAPVLDACRELDVLLEAAWEGHLGVSPTARRIEAGEYDARLYAIYLIETFHYTKHNARNQALVGVRSEAPPEYLRYCFRHALEETGHELMALHDLQKLGVCLENTPLPAPLSETEVLIAYLYWVSASGDPLGRLGYSYWAEDAYRHIQPLFSAVTKKLGLTSATSTFLSAHAAIDEEHAAAVRSLVKEQVRTPEQLSRIAEVMQTSLALTMRLFDALDREYRLVQESKSTRYRFKPHAS
jgi:hypothetical protein